MNNIGKKKMLLFLSLFLFINTSLVKADECTEEELEKIKKQTEDIEIFYEHLGEVTKEDGSKVYDEFMVTAENIPDDIYVHLDPMTEEQFDESKKNTLKITLTTGTWTYGLYSKKCEEIVDEINVNLPKFNVYSLNKLCDGVDPKEFEWCSKYYYRTIDEKMFESKIKAYRYKNHLDDEDYNKKKESKINEIIKFILEEKIYLYIGIGLSVVIIIVLIITIIRKRNKRKILQ